MYIKITKKHIKQGRPGEPSKCPIALSLSDKFPYSICSVYTETARIFPTQGTELNKYLLSSTAQKFVTDFDTHKKVSPATFYLKEI